MARWLVALAWLWAVLPAAGAPSSGAHEHFSLALGLRLELLEDPGHELTIDDVLRSPWSERFEPSRSAEPNLGFTRSAHWARFTVPDYAPGELMLEVASPLLDDVRLYLPRRDGPYEVRYAGDTSPYAARELDYRHFVFHLRAAELRPDRVVYMRFATSGGMQLPLTLWSRPAFAEHATWEELVNGLFFGLLIALALYNLMLYFAVRDSSYLYYVVYITLFGLLQASLFGFAYQYLWQDWTWWAGRAPVSLGALSIIAALAFSGHFLRLREHARPWHRTFQAAIAFGVLTLLAALLAEYRVAARMVTFLSMFIAFAILPAAILVWMRGFRPARFFVFAWAAFLLSVLATGMMYAGYLPRNVFTLYGSNLGNALEMILLSFALADRINAMRRENERIQAEAHRKLRVVAAQLEAQVRERTEELRAAKERAERASEELAETNRMLVDLAARDGLTGLLNRRAFTESLEFVFSQAKRHGFPIALVLIDIDRFKRINDTLGHQAGDRVLVEFAGLLKQKSRASDLVGRFGGEEFIVLLSHSDRSACRIWSSRLLRAVRELRFGDHPSLRVTASFGVTWMDAEHKVDTPRQLIAEADRALYAAKDAGRDCVLALDELEPARV
jgi:diguanylate cyclase (GGDEF)-like protein